MDLARELKKVTEHEGDDDNSYNWRTRNSPKRLGKEAGRMGNRRTSKEHPDYSIAQIGENPEKSPRKLRRLPFIQTPVKDHQLTLV